MGLTPNLARCTCGAYLIAAPDGSIVACLGHAHRHPVAHRVTPAR